MYGGRSRCAGQVRGWRRCPGGEARQAGDQEPADGGSAIVEFLGVGLLLLIPLVYLIIVLGEIQAATFAVQGGAREAARMLATAPDAAHGGADAHAAIDLALADHGLAGGSLLLSCASDECLQPGGTVEVAVRVDVPLPWVPALVQEVVPLTVPVSASYIAPLDDLAARP